MWRHLGRKRQRRETFIAPSRYIYIYTKMGVRERKGETSSSGVGRGGGECRRKRRKRLVDWRFILVSTARKRGGFFYCCCCLFIAKRGKREEIGENAVLDFQLDIVVKLTHPMPPLCAPVDYRPLNRTSSQGRRRRRRRRKCHRTFALAIILTESVIIPSRFPASSVYIYIKLQKNKGRYQNETRKLT